MLVIHKVINNNVVSILDEEGKEQIVMGKGIAFQKRSGEELDESLINKRFYLKDSNANERFERIISEIPSEYLSTGSEIVELAKLTLNKNLNESLIISLTDHIYTTVQRYKDGISLTNPLLWEIKRYYEPEYEIALKTLEIISEKFGVNLPEDEAGFITVHIVDSEMENCTIDDVNQITKFIQDICSIVKYFFNVDFDTKSVNYYRFITHIKFFAQRVILKNAYLASSDDSLYEIIKEKYINAYNCVLKIEDYISKNYSYEISNEEKLYLMIHIERVVYKTNN